MEVDGSIYHQDLQKEAERDFCIIRALGSDWRIFHIPDNVAKNIAKSRYYIKSIIEGGNNDNQTGKC